MAKLFASDTAMKVTVDAGFWPLGSDTQRYRGMLIFTPHKTGAHILAQLHEGRTVVATVHCELVRKEIIKGHAKFVISEYADTP
ncbi:hypothetical protein CVU75_03815 [Candidatus Dependentiae bacterium HGW-Dependentiae-1]|nr:MAG: hypothetical protein CVU75_03815 [Candidatus Dependentiae bacterium HGW-Dependentiae-1]